MTQQEIDLAFSIAATGNCNTSLLKDGTIQYQHPSAIVFCKVTEAFESNKFKLVAVVQTKNKTWVARITK